MEEEVREGEGGWKKTLLRRGFVRVKETLYSYRNGVVRISIKPGSKTLERTNVAYPKKGLI